VFLPDKGCIAALSGGKAGWKFAQRLVAFPVKPAIRAEVDGVAQKLFWLGRL
jgi:hypothetical protein